MTGASGARVGAAVLMMLLPALVVGAPGGRDGGMQVLPARLPSPRDAMALAASDDHAYLFGGYDGRFLRDALRFDLATRELCRLPAQLPAGIVWAAAVWAGDAAYLFGGVWDEDWNHPSDAILRFDPVLQLVHPVGARLPFGRAVSGAVWDGHAAYIFGGSHGFRTWTDEIVRYDPATDRAEVVARLPFGNDYMSVAWDGTHAYLLGGHTSPGPVVRFTPSTNEVRVLAASLPAARMGTSAVWAGKAAYVFGGWDPSFEAKSDVWRFDPHRDEASSTSAELPSARGNTQAAWDGHSAFVFGGRGAVPQPAFLDEVLEFTPKGHPRGGGRDAGPLGGLPLPPATLPLCGV